MIQVEGHPHLKRDEKNSAVVTAAGSEYEAYMQIYRNKMTDVERINLLEQRVIEQDKKLDLILSLLKEK